MKNKKSNIHANHRKRVKNRFISDGNLDSFEEHQILELLLFYAVPRKDTNELAHRMLNEYGSLYNLLNAKPEELVKRCNVSINIAVLISMMPFIFRKFLKSDQDKNNICIKTKNQAYEYFKSLLIGKPIESFFMLCLDINKNIVRVVKISDGISNRSPVYIEKVVEDALLYNSQFVLIGHNHPHGNKNPSSNDFTVTMAIISALEYVNIIVLDHIIIYNGGYYSFAEKNSCGLSYDL